MSIRCQVTCYGIVKDGNGFEPRKKGLGLRPWPGIVTWLKQYTEKDCPSKLAVSSLVPGKQLELMGPSADLFWATFGACRRRMPRARSDQRAASERSR